MDFDWTITEGMQNVDIKEMTPTKLILEGVTVGSVTVKAVSRSAPNVSDTAIVNVMPEPDSGLTIGSLDIPSSMIYGDEYPAYAEIINNEGYSLNWKITNGTAVKISEQNNEDATLAAIKAGDAIVTVSIREYPGISKSVDVNVLKATPSVILPPTTASISYGATLSDCNLVGGKVEFKGNEIEGTWEWAEPDRTPSGGQREYKAVFTPEDESLNEVTTSVSIYVDGDISATIDIDDVQFDKSSSDSGDVSFEIDKGTYGIEGIMCGNDVLISGKDYVIAGGHVSIKEEFLSTLKDGTYTFTIVMDGGDNPTFELMVFTSAPDNIPVTSVTLDRTSAQMNVGTSLNLTAKVAPSNATNRNVVWTSSNNGVASVSGGKVTAGTVEGTAIITAMAGGKAATCTVTVVQNVTKLRTPMTKYNISKKKTITVPVVCDSGSLVVTSKLTATSSNTKVATATVSGKNVKIKADKKKTGTAKITIKSANGKPIVITVKVVKKAVKIKKVKVKGLKKKYKKGKTAQITAKPSNAKATNLKVTYKSSKSSVASVDKAGKVTFKKKGKVTLTVKIGKKSVKKKITVK